jgi:hypothetical protein
MEVSVEMIDLSEFQTTKKRACLTDTVASALSPADREKFDAACAERRTITNASVRNWLIQKTGTEISESSVRNHRKGECACG